MTSSSSGIYFALQSLPTSTHGENPEHLANKTATAVYLGHWLHKPGGSFLLAIYSLSDRLNRVGKVSTNHWQPFCWCPLFLKHLTFISFSPFFLTKLSARVGSGVKLRSSQLDSPFLHKQHSTIPTKKCICVTLCTDSALQKAARNGQKRR